MSHENNEAAANTGPQKPTHAVDYWPCGTPKRKSVEKLADPDCHSELIQIGVLPQPLAMIPPIIDRELSSKPAHRYPCGGARAAEFAAPSSSCVTPPDALSINRRSLLIGGGAVIAAASGYQLWANANLPRAAVFVARNQRYDGPLATTIREGLLAAGFDATWIRGRRVLLKPNLVEPSRHSPQMTTHPLVVLAAAEVFLRWGATVTIGEGPGHVRDTENALDESGLAPVLDDARLNFVDLNYQETAWLPNRGKASSLAGFHFPRSVVEADLLVSLPKMKTHHWVGFTAAMKNFYGVIPGIRYGWPKNVLHHNGIPETIYDINASIPRAIGIVDGIECMEGDGPILGTPKPMGLLLMGTNLTALDATVGRIMGLLPDKVSYLQLAADRLGPVADSRIEQRGEAWQPLVSPFKVLDEPHLKILTTQQAQLIT
jgi:uncharacterized protein (DUF362 family)